MEFAWACCCFGQPSPCFHSEFATFITHSLIEMPHMLSSQPQIFFTLWPNSHGETRRKLPFLRRRTTWWSRTPMTESHQWARPVECSLDPSAQTGQPMWKALFSGCNMILIQVCSRVVLWEVYDLSVAFSVLPRQDSNSAVSHWAIKKRKADYSSVIAIVCHQELNFNLTILHARFSAQAGRSRTDERTSRAHGLLASSTGGKPMYSRTTVMSSTYSTRLKSQPQSKFLQHWYLETTWNTCIQGTTLPPSSLIQRSQASLASVFLGLAFRYGSCIRDAPYSSRMFTRFTSSWATPDQENFGCGEGYTLFVKPTTLCHACLNDIR